MTTSPTDTRTVAQSTFPRTSGRVRGYAPKDVDAFLERARLAFENPQADTGFRAADIRTAAFPLVKRGYQPDAVDAALSRVEDAFAARERKQALSASGAGAWIDQTRAQAQEILERLTREPKRRFSRARGLGYGYRIDEVDLVADKIAAYLSDGRPVTVEQVRTVAFRMQRRGYREEQVDALLDAVVDVMLAVG
ncbi:DivIVA domain-containing protein [Microbacterium horticulturae]|uniref:DivIVA domain-containing protein n=1 Tax=Microbacterium horticulturae TaxID=3028316 RepID=A0ABY8C2H3_9MICO|nr:DivIVA domain-containing protein [Microbacterium sp. KACC 23027]WEG10594.1 DivIVA domain-containing protein [Microbacterium sp. KACC 23027]